jgi:hypothetical protein
MVGVNILIQLVAALLLLQFNKIRSVIIVSCDKQITFSKVTV